MKKNILLILLFVCVAVAGFSQETDTPEADTRETDLQETDTQETDSQEADTQEADSQEADVRESNAWETNLYTFFTNVIVTERFRSSGFGFPLIGLVNIAKGNYSDAHLGLVNWNTGNFTGLQLGFVNTVGGSVTGMRAGFINTARGDENGLQIGFVNAAGGNENGLQTGFVNAIGGGANGIHIGFVNAIGGSGNGIHIGFVNAVGGSENGIQAGFVNIVAKETNGVQFGFVNVAAKGIHGSQTGFFNYADRIERGVPIGFVSIVRHGGYQAAEFSFSDFYPVQFAVKLGMEKFYTSIIGAYDFDRKDIACGFGLGKIITVGNAFFLAPEINFMNTTTDGRQMFLSLLPYFGYAVTRHLSIVFGPSVTWAHQFGGEVSEKPFFSIYEHTIDSGNRITAGAKAGLRFRL
ncbi:MAG: hypothetical protein LBL31_07595 [Spirochaetaceae bacterium]|jgi:hypothetical protein|nr:hypothetical protein [Spirochaetaceae bacterium]